MTSLDLVALVAETTMATSAAIALVLVARRPFRQYFGAAAGYGLWVLVPTALTAVLMPAATVVRAPAPTTRMSGVVDIHALAQPSTLSFDFAPWLCALWLLGAAAVGLRFLGQQRAFRRALGNLQACGEGQYRADSVAGLPAAIGLRRPMIVLPADFESRYTPEQRALMQAHERSHIQRGDLQLNALVALLRCLFWFNPLVHVAARCFRHDQELACDQQVIASHPQSRRAYGDAIFHTQLAGQPLPLGCHWGFTHPLKERIAMLKQPVPSRARWLGGSAIVMALALFAGVGAWAAQPKAIAATSDVSAGNIKVQLWVRINGGDAKPPMVTLTNPGEPFSFEIEDDGHLWALTGSSRMLDDGKLHFSSAVSKDGATFAEPSMIVTDGEPASLVIGEELDGGGFEGLQVDVVLEVMTGTVGGGPENGFVPVDTEGTVGPVPDRASRQASPPRYPEAALEQGISGKLVLLVDIDSRGRPTAVEVETAEPAGVFDQAAMDAVRNWKFEPAIENGRPAASRIRVPIHFEADGRPPGDKSAVDETIGWFTPDLSKDPPRVAEVTCDEARADTEGKEVACGNRLVKPNDTGTPPDPTKIEMPIEPRTGSPVIDAEILAVPDTLPLVAGVEACPEGAFLGPASVGKGRQMACLSRDDGGNQHQNLVDRIRRSIVDRGGALVAKF